MGDGSWAKSPKLVVGETFEHIYAHGNGKAEIFGINYAKSEKNDYFFCTPEYCNQNPNHCSKIKTTIEP